MQTRSPLIGALFWKRAADAMTMIIGRRHGVGSALRQRLIGDGQQLFTLGVDDVPDAEDGTELIRHLLILPGDALRLGLGDGAAIPRSSPSCR
jgi:hypothetical protein